MGFPVIQKKTVFKELDGISYDDKTHNVFYNASAYLKEEDEQIRSVLEFIYKLKAKTPFTKQLEDYVLLAKTTGLMRDEYMYFQDILEEEKELARELGHNEGLKEGQKQGIQKGLSDGISEGSMNNRIETVKRMHKENCSIDLISRITDFSKEEILELIS